MTPQSFSSKDYNGSAPIPHKDLTSLEEFTCTTKKIWKETYNDNRDWAETNEMYVIRGKFFFDFRFAANWGKELEKMNRGKRGGQYLYPNSFIEYLAVWHQWADYRGLEGI